MRARRRRCARRRRWSDSPRADQLDRLVLADLKALDGSGVMILVCGTCLDYFHLLDKKQVGETTNMLDIVTAMQLADKVINI